MELLDVTTDPAFRVTLRAYAIPPAHPRVRVAVFQDTPLTDFQVPASRLLSERFFDLTTSPFGPLTGSFSRPAGIVIGDVVAPTALATPVRIEVQSVTPGVPVWAFASVTNNVTQQVTTVTPTTAMTPVSVPTSSRLAVGHWGSPSGCIDVTEAQVTLSTGCGAGSFSPPTLGVDHRFEVDGVFGINIGPVVNGRRPAHFAGVLQGTQLTVTISSDNLTGPPITVQLGSAGICGVACP